MLSGVFFGALPHPCFFFTSGGGGGAAGLSEEAVGGAGGMSEGGGGGRESDGGGGGAPFEGGGGGGGKETAPFLCPFIVSEIVLVELYAQKAVDGGDVEIDVDGSCQECLALESLSNQETGNFSTTVSSLENL
jgi:hypothetical protein